MRTTSSQWLAATRARIAMITLVFCGTSAADAGRRAGGRCLDLLHDVHARDDLAEHGVAVAAGIRDSRGWRCRPS